MFTRDSALWWLGIIAALIVYLSAAPPPTAWSYEQWLQFAAFVVSTASAKLATSPLGGKSSDSGVSSIGRGAGVVLLVGVLALPALGCGGKQVLTVPTVPAVSLHARAELAARIKQAGEITLQAQSIEIGLYQLGTPGLTKDVHIIIQQALLGLSVAMQAGTTTLATMSAEQSLAALSATLASALDQADASLTPITGTAGAVIRSCLKAVRLTLSVASSLTSARAEWDRTVQEVQCELGNH